MVTPHLLEQLADGLWRILHEHRHADRIAQQLLRPFPAQDQRRALIARTIYGVLRHLRLLIWLAGEDETFSRQQLLTCVRHWCVLDKIPLSRTLRRGVPPRRELLQRWESPPSHAIRYSIPDWLNSYGVQQLGTEKWEQFLAAIEREPIIILRTNTLRIERDQLQKQLVLKGIVATPHPLASEALVLDEYVNVFALEEFHQGLFEVQDVGSQVICHRLGVAPGMRVVDACAGTGGKSLHLAALMTNRGRIIALDTESWKLDELRRRATRAGISIIETRTITSSKIIKRLSGSVDRLLLDVPCSGSGVWRRNPDGKWHLQPDDIPRLQQLQSRLLRSYLSMLASSGIALYCTCSIFPDEGERIIAELCDANQQWECLEQGRLNPFSDNSDGFFWALLQRR